MQSQANNDLLWARLLGVHLPPADFPTSPSPSPSYRDLYISHHPYWFLPQYKIWFSNEDLIGKLILVKFDPQRGCIEGRRLLADRSESMVLVWPHEPSVWIHLFTPRIHLWVDDPVLKLNYDPTSFSNKLGWWEGEIEMKSGRSAYNASKSFFLAQNIPESRQYPNMELWPPKAIPNMPRVRSLSQNKFRGKEHKPQKYEDISQTTFRLRQWSHGAQRRAFFGVRTGEEVKTWSTIDPVLYTPTKARPYQGIYVGEYGAHGCEFLLVTQTAKAPDPPERTGSSHTNYFQRVTVAAGNALAEMNRAPARTSGSADEEEFCGAIEAIKLTGDTNVPRGEHTFIADDIGPGGLIRIADEPPFQGARVVKSRGHVASPGFVDGEYLC